MAKPKLSKKQTSTEPDLPFLSNSANLNESEWIFQVNISNIYDYFSRGLILPVKYISNRTTEDIQSKYPDYLVVSKGYLEELTDIQVIISITLNSIDVQNINRVGDILFLDYPLPITRIKKIFVYDDEIKNQILSTAKTQNAGIIPERLFDSITINNRSKWLKQKTIKKSPVDNGRNEVDNIKHFDRVLGMFAFMRNSEIYYANKSESIANFSPYFFTAAGLINDKLKLQSEFYEINPTREATFRLLLRLDNPTDKPVLPKIVNDLFAGEVFDKKYIERNQDEFISNLSDKKYNKEIKTAISNLINPLGRSKAIPLLEESESKEKAYFVILAYLHLYSQKGDQDLLKQKITTELPHSHAEICLALLGQYFGYQSLRNYEKIEISDPFLRHPYTDNLFPIKFQLNSELDYQLIESIYQFVFKNSSNDFYFEKLTEKINLPSFNDNYEVKSFTHFGKEIFSIKKIQFHSISTNSNENYENRLSITQSKTILENTSQLDLLKEDLSKYPEFISSEYALWNFAIKYKIISFPRDQFIELILKDTSTNFEEIKSLMNHDTKFNNIPL